MLDEFDMDGPRAQLKKQIKTLSAEELSAFLYDHRWQIRKELLFYVAVWIMMLQLLI